VETLAPGASLKPNHRQRWQSSSCSNLAFSELDLELPPKKIQPTYELHWKPIFKMMKLSENLAIIENSGQINAQFLEDTFKKAKEYLKT